MKKTIYKIMPIFKILFVILVSLVFLVMPVFIIKTKEQPPTISPEIQNPGISFSNIELSNATEDAEGKYYQDVSFKIDEEKLLNWEITDYVFVVTNSKDASVVNPLPLKHNGEYLIWTKKNDFANESIFKSSSFYEYFESYIDSYVTDITDAQNFASDCNEFNFNSQVIESLPEDTYKITGVAKTQYDQNGIFKHRTDLADPSTFDIRKPEAAGEATITILDDQIDSENMVSGFSKTRTNHRTNVTEDHYYNNGDFNYLFQYYNSKTELSVNDYTNWIKPRIQFVNHFEYIQNDINIFSVAPYLNDFKIYAVNDDERLEIYNSSANVSYGGLYTNSFAPPEQTIHENCPSFYEHGIIKDKKFEYEVSGNVSYTLKSREEITTELAGYSTINFEDEKNLLLENKEHKLVYHFENSESKAAAVEIPESTLPDQFSNILNQTVEFNIAAETQGIIFPHWEDGQFVFSWLVNENYLFRNEYFRKNFSLGIGLDFVSQRGTKFMASGRFNMQWMANYKGHDYFYLKSFTSISFNEKEKYLLASGAINFNKNAISNDYQFDGSFGYSIAEKTYYDIEIVEMGNTKVSQEDFDNILEQMYYGDPILYIVLPSNISQTYDNHEVNMKEVTTMFIIIAIILFVLPILLMTTWVIIKKTTRW